jgi:predicted permease
LDELDSELQFHIDMRAEANQRAGMSKAEARRQAQLSFGNALLERERTRDAGVARWLDAILQDLRYALRMMGRSPGLASVIVLSLALGIGANTAFFTLTNALLLRTLPVHDPNSLVSLEILERGAQRAGDAFTNPIWEEIRDHQSVFSGAFAYSAERFDASDGGQSRMLTGAFASGDVFTTLGLEPAVGRLFSRLDDQHGGGQDGPVAVLGYHFWQRAYGGDPFIAGKTIRLRSKPFRIIGVAPRGFDGILVGQRFDVIVPLGTEAYLQGERSSLKVRNDWFLSIVARLKPEYSLQAAQQGLRAVCPVIFTNSLPPNRTGERASDFINSTLPLKPAGRGLSIVGDDPRRAVFLLNGVVGLVLLIACANVANLLLARATTRQREFSVRLALGASRGRLLRQSLLESFLFSIAGAALGLALAPGAASLLLRANGTARTQITLDLTPDAAVLLFTTFCSLFCGLLFGLAPAWRASRANPQPGLRENVGAASDHKGRLRSVLVAVQVALSVVILVGAGLFLTTFQNLTKVDLGFDPSNVLLVSADTSRMTVSDADRPNLLQNMRERLRAIPGVRDSSASALTPIGPGMWNMALSVDDGQGGRKRKVSMVNVVSPDYFRTLGTPLLAGRDFNNGDRKNSRQVIIVNRRLARDIYGDANPVGKLVWEPGRPGAPGSLPKELEIVGVVADATYHSLRVPPPPTVYMPLSQSEMGPSVTFALRAASQPESLTPAVRDALAEFSPSITFTPRTFQTQVRDAMTTERLLAALSTLFGCLALALAALGLYGVLAYTVAQRQGEIGIRMALGAAPAQIRNWVLRQGIGMVAAGALAGLAASYGLAPLAKSLLYGIKPNSWMAYAAGAAILLLMGVSATWLPARRATRLDPIRALRHD